MTDPNSQIERAIDGDPDALQAVWAANRRWVAGVILAHKPREADLEDLLQDVAMKLVRRIHTIHDPGALRQWLRSVAINAARTAGRRQRLRPRPFGRTDLLADGSPERGPDAGAQDLGRAALEAAQRLPEHYRECVILRCVRGMSYRQIADVMGLPVGTVETRLARARRMLREELESEVGGMPAGATP